MEFVFNGNSPICAQIVERFEQAIAGGELSAGERLPSVREMAASAGVNPNTMQKAMLLLEERGLVTTHRNTCKCVTDDASLIGAVREELVETEINGFFERMGRLGLDEAAAAALIGRRTK